MFLLLVFIADPERGCQGLGNRSTDLKPDPTLPRSRLPRLRGTVADWLTSLEPTTEIVRLLRRSGEERRARGYDHTLREICQQPVTWLETAGALASDSTRLRSVLDSAGILRRRGAMILTGSGSSLYAGECLALPLQEALGVSVQAIPAGTLLTHPHGSVPPVDPYLVVSFARSGNSPESRAVVDLLLERDDRGRHLIITCNRRGALVTGLASHPRVDSLVLDEKTEDKSLVMTSSFTNMVLAGRFLACTGEPREALARFEAMAEAAAGLIERESDDLARVARSGFGRAVFLGSGCRTGSAHEAGLKMLEMTAGRIPTMSESFLGLRHGPMSAIHADTLIVAFLSSDPVVRAYELDLLRELDRKELGALTVVVGSSLPSDLPRRAGDLLVECGPSLTDADLAVLDVLVGQVFAFHRCLEEGLEPDSPSAGGVINRVVESFAIHRRH
jgi:tagatose-6-phosphate ketose/aldose isomerase